MSRMLRLNLGVGLLALIAWWVVVLRPLYALVHLGLKPHGSLAEDPDFYFALVAACLIELGQGLAITNCLAGMACAFGSALGFTVEAARRARARRLFWTLPVLWFSVELLGRFQIQRWYAERGVLFPFTSFLREFAPHLPWLLAVGLCTAPAILTGRGLYDWIRPQPEPPSSLREPPV